MPFDFNAGDGESADSLDGIDPPSNEWGQVPPAPEPVGAAVPNIQPDPLEWDKAEPITGTYLPSFQITENFLDSLKKATLDKSSIHKDDISWLQEPKPVSIDLLDSSNQHHK